MSGAPGWQRIQLLGRAGGWQIKLLEETIKDLRG
jgi:hypothetical protein